MCTAALVAASVPLRGVAQGLVLEAALLLALGSVLHARRTHRPVDRRPWDFLCLGLLTLLAYSVAWFIWFRGETAAAPVLAVVPLVTFGAFVVAGVGVVLRHDGQALAGLLDAGVVALAVALTL